jgi:hypothetical protein
MELDVITVVPRLGRWDGGQNRWVTQATNTLQLVSQDNGFEFQLVLIWYMLVVAAATYPEVWAARFDPGGGGLQHFQELATRVARPVLHQAYTHLLAWQDVGHEDGAPIFQATQTLTPVGHGRDRDIKAGISHHRSLPGGCMCKSCIISWWVKKEGYLASITHQVPNHLKNAYLTQSQSQGQL